MMKSAERTMAAMSALSGITAMPVNAYPKPSAIRLIAKAE